VADERRTEQKNDRITAKERKWPKKSEENRDWVRAT
jgi:hypothetical protein